MDGKLSIREDCIYIHAKPMIMSRIRALFPDLKRHPKAGQYTNNIIQITLHNKNAKDIAWLCMRYEFEMSQEDREKISAMSVEFDRQVQKIRDIYQSKGEYNPVDSYDIVGKVPRDYQVHALDLFNQVGRLLITDEMGTGKTLQALMMLAQAKCRPAVIVLPVHLIKQWQAVIGTTLPQAKTQLIKTGDADFKHEDNVDFFLVTYDKFKRMYTGFKDANIKTLLGDEIHHIRNSGTDRYNAFERMTKRVHYAVGLTGTPVFNNGVDLFNILDIVNPGCLGDRDSFFKEWCEYDSYKMTYKVRDPDLLFNHLIESGLMIRRTRKQLGKYFKPKNIEYIEIDASLEELKSEINVLKKLALGVLSLNSKDSSENARDFNIKLRQATGLAKAKTVAKLADTIIQEKGNVIISGWHRGFWEIIGKELKKYNPQFITGAESSKQKDDAIKTFEQGKSQVLCISHKSGEGIDGLQYHCSTIIHGEFAWNPMTHEQLDARIDREGQENFVDIIYPYIVDGSDPIVMQIINNKKDESYKLIGEQVTNTTPEMDNLDYIKEMARKFLNDHKVEYDEALEQDENESKIINVIKTFSHAGSSESEMQDRLYILLQTIENATIDKEYKFSERSRLDFKITLNNKVYVVECKSNARNKREAHRQIERYIDEVKPAAVFVVAPWIGVKDFIIKDTKVFILNYMV